MNFMFYLHLYTGLILNIFLAGLNIFGFDLLIIEFRYLSTTIPPDLTSYNYEVIWTAVVV